MKAEKRLFLLLILSSVLATMFLASLAGTAHAQVSTQLIIQPVTPSNINFLANFTTLPTTITFNMTVMNVTNMGSWQLTIEWNETLLSYNSISLPSDNVFFNMSPIVAGPDTSVAGLVTYGAAAGPSQPSFNGSGVLAQLVLNVNTTMSVPSSCPVDFEGITVDTFLTALDLSDISFTPMTSTFSDTYAIGTMVTHTIPGSSIPVSTTSNGTIQPNSGVIDTVGKTISFNVTGNTGDTAFLYVDLPKNVINVTNNDITRWNITANGSVEHPQITQNDTNTFMFEYITLPELVTIKVGGDNVIPELSSMLVLLIIASSITVAVAKAKTRKN